MTFNEKIDKYMEENDIPNLKQFANMAGIPYTTLRDFYEKQSADNSRLSTIRTISEFMKCSMDYLSFDDLNLPNQIKINGIDLNNDISLDSIDNYNRALDEVELLFDKHKDILTSKDKAIIKTIIEERKKEIDKELGEE